MSEKTISKRPSADATRLCILRVAKKLFTSHGFAGTSISDIAKKAKINQSLIYHHFGSKEDLWKHVKSDILSSFFELKGFDFEDFAKIETADEFIQEFIKFRFELYDKNPEIRRMIAWQQLEPKNKHVLQGIRQSTHQQLCKMIKRYQDDGQLRNDYSAELIFILIATASVQNISDHPLLAKHDKAQHVADKQAYIDLTIECLLAGLRA